jgi:energy-converting hydrogenase Eha subunit A
MCTNILNGKCHLLKSEEETSLDQSNISSAPFPELLAIILVLFWLSPVIWGFLCSLPRKRFLGLFLLFLPLIVTLILWPNLLRLGVLFEYPLAIYIVPSFIGYTLGLVLVKREKPAPSKAEVAMGFGLIIFFVGYSLMLVDHLGHGVLKLFHWAVLVLVIGAVVGALGVAAKFKRS